MSYLDTVARFTPEQWRLSNKLGKLSRLLDALEADWHAEIGDEDDEVFARLRGVLDGRWEEVGR